MGDGTGCDNMTAVIAKLKPGAFKTKLDSEKRPASPELEQPAAKKAKTEIASESDDVKKEEELH